ncbi:MAG: hypothetical protein H7296_08475 [Bacteroidia bacterium]|nr:hypothetical protein [Bacteroidia bacterium]
MKQQPEYILQKSICRYLSIAYPEIPFLSDTVASVQLTIPQGARNKAIQKQGFKTPDLLVFKPNDKYHGLFIELKTETPFKKNGEIKASQKDHLLLQQQTIADLNALGYHASFSWGFDMTKEVIDKYMTLK